MNFTDFKWERKGLITLSYLTSTDHWTCVLYFILNTHPSFSHWESNILSFTEEKRKKKNLIALVPKALPLPYQDLFSMGVTKQRGKKNLKGSKLPPKSEPKWWFLETKSRESIFQDLNPPGNWLWRYGQQTIHETGETGSAFPFFQYYSNLPNALGLQLCWGGLHILNYLQ